MAAFVANYATDLPSHLRDILSPNSKVYTYYTILTAGSLTGRVQIDFFDTSPSPQNFRGGFGPTSIAVKIHAGKSLGYSQFNYGVDWLSREHWEAKCTVSVAPNVVIANLVGMKGETIGYFAGSSGESSAYGYAVGKGQFGLSRSEPA